MLSEFDVEGLTEETASFSGAEIEQAVVSAMYDAFDDNGRPFTTEDILKAVRETFPLAMTMREQIDELREWATDRARPASTEGMAAPEVRRSSGPAGTTPAWLRKRRASNLSIGERSRPS